MAGVKEVEISAMDSGYGILEKFRDNVDTAIFHDKGSGTRDRTGFAHFEGCCEGARRHLSPDW
jgi:hypothetical protein